MDLVSFGVICWFVSFMCFAYIGIELWGEYERDEITWHWIRTRAANRYAMLEYRDKIIRNYGLRTAANHIHSYRWN